MSAQTAHDDYEQSPPRRILFRPDAQVIELPRKSSEGQSDQNSPEQNHHESAQMQTANSGPNSGPRITVRDLPGEFDSVTTVWTDAPEPLCHLVARTTAARTESRTPADVGLACWAVLVLIPRAGLHLASWLLTHPLRSLTAAVLIALLIATW